MAPMVNASHNVPRPVSPRRRPLRNRVKSTMITSNIARPSTTKSAAMPRLNHGDELIAPNVPAVRMTITPEHAVDERHRAAVDGPEQESRGRASTARRRPRPDNGKVDRDHRQDAGRQVEREAAKEDEREDRERSAALEESLRLHAAVPRR